MQLIQSIMTQNPCYKTGRKIAVRGLMLHSVGCPQANAGVFIRNWNTPSHTTSCVHGFIDANTGVVYQTLPWNHRGWHGGGASNNTHIGVEMCEPDCIKYVGGAKFTCSDVNRAKDMVTRTYKSAVELFAYLCKLYGLNPLADGVIISHYEGAKRGIACNHGDPEHLWNGLGIGYTMNKFRQDVKACMNGVAVNTQPVVAVTEPKITKVNGILEVICADGVNVRTQPNTSCSIVCVGEKGNKFGVIGITEDKQWYKLANNLFMSANASLVKFTETKTETKKEESKQPDPTIVNATIQENTGSNDMRLYIIQDGDTCKVKTKTGFYLTASTPLINENIDFRKDGVKDGDECCEWKLIKKTYKNADYTMLQCAANEELFLSVQDNGMNSTNLKLYTDLHNMKQKFYVREESDGSTLLLHAYTTKCVTARN